MDIVCMSYYIYIKFVELNVRFNSKVIDHDVPICKDSETVSNEFKKKGM